jgi:hypothetical protein
MNKSQILRIKPKKKISRKISNIVNHFFPFKKQMNSWKGILRKLKLEMEILFQNFKIKIKINSQVNWIYLNKALIKTLCKIIIKLIFNFNIIIKS